MSARTRKRHASEAAALAQTAPAPSANLGAWGKSGWDAANHSTRRGYIYFPTLETRKEVDTYSRLELIRRGRWLKRNTGFAKRCINGVANMVGALTPRAMTGDRDWNRASEQLWRERAGSAETFDLSGRFNVNSYQPLLTRSRLCDGDILSVFTTKHGGAAVMTYESHQVAAGKRIIGTDGWRDGVLLDSNEAALAYSIVSDFSTGDTVDIPASACALHADFDSFGWNRGPSALSHAINNLLDTTEITSDLKLGIKTANRIGYYEYSAPGSTPVARGAGDIARQNMRPSTSPSGSKILLEDTFRGGKIPELEPGREIKQLLDQRPHPNSLQFLEYLCRDIAWGLGISADILWNLAKLGGASVRCVLADAQIFITSQQQMLVDQFLTRYWIYFCAVEMQAGRLPRCKDPKWWLNGWLPPAQLTVDIARDGKLSIDLHKNGMLTAKRWYGMQGLDDEEEDRQRVEEYARRIVLCLEIEERYANEGRKIKIDPERVFPTAIVGAAMQPSSHPSDSGNSEDDAPEGRFSDPEAFTRFESRLDELEERFAA